MPDDYLRRNRMEVVAAILIGVAAILTAVASYQGALLDGQIDRAFADSLSSTIQANDAYNLSDAQQAIERDWIFGWIIEVENGTPANKFLEKAMPEEILALASEWAAADDGVLDPFSADAAVVYESYSSLPSVKLLAEGDQLSNQATCSVLEAQVLSHQGARKGLSTIFLAIALVVGGVAALLHGRLARNIVLATALSALLLGAGILVIGADAGSVRAELAPSYFEEDSSGAPIAPEDAAAVADATCNNS